MGNTRAVVVLAVLLSLCGCELYHVVFGTTEDEVAEALSLVLNVFADTSPFVTPETVWYDSQSNRLYYTTPDGEFSCIYDAWMCSQTFYDYSPQFSDYLISGEVTSEGPPVPAGTEYQSTFIGTLELTGGEVSALVFDFTIIVAEDGSIADLQGNIAANDREFSDSDLFEPVLVEVIVDNADILYEILQIVVLD